MAAFVACVFEPSDIVEVRRLPSEHSSWFAAEDLANASEGLTADNRRKENIYAGGNPRKQIGGKAKEDIALARCLWVDWDGGTTEQEARAKIVQAELPAPTLLIASGGGIHAWWRLAEPITDLAEFTRLQKKIIAATGADGSIHDAPRIMRLPGFLNQKPKYNPAPVCRILEADPSRRWTLQELVGHLPEVTTPALAPAINGTPVSAGVTDLVRAAAWINAVPAANDGERNKAAYNAAAMLVKDYNLSDSEARPLLARWNQGNNPALDDAELDDVLQNARKYGDHAPGQKLAERPKMSGYQSHDSNGKARGTAVETRQHVPIEYESISLADLKDTPDPEYFIDGILERSQPGVIAGQYKTLKTTLAVELSYCLATGSPFLGIFPPNKTARVGMFSGEAGRAQIRDTVRRVAASHGDYSPWDHKGFYFSCDKMPKIGSLEYEDALVRWVEKHNHELVIIDPGYAALAAVGEGAGNYYKVAELLFRVTEMQKKTGCVMLLCPHMTKAPKYDPPMLSDIQWSGFSEWSGQWILLGKRREWDDQRGDHWLWMVAGGRSGHADTWGLDVHEGRKEDIAGKVFRPAVLDKNLAYLTAADAVRQKKDRDNSREHHRSKEGIKAAFASLDDVPQFKKHVMERAASTGRGVVMAAVWAEMLRTGEVITHPGACRCGKNKPCDGYTLRPSKD
ncbi:MAG: AAA family ATPase [Pirellulaceae bacterium]|nr:AAA family ATPase [Pirellulaceae bacterium]